MGLRRGPLQLVRRFASHPSGTDFFKGAPELLNRRVVVTGLGIVCPLGVGVQTAWRELVAGKTATRRIREEDLPEVRPWRRGAAPACPLQAAPGGPRRLEAEPGHTPHPTHTSLTADLCAPCWPLLLLQAHRAALPQLPCQVAAFVPREQLHQSRHYPAEVRPGRGWPSLPSS
jgi:hypothetical protein